MAIDAGRARKAAATCFALALACFLFAAFALWPRPVESGGERVRTVVLDASASVARLRPGWAGRFASILRAEAQAAMGAGQSLSVITVSPQAQRRFGPGA
ncbi:MAG: hypothetical protein KDB61_12390, partial [Planctomycetes bacterium]|nr:hypothetical protein [Planctomycetota bacterium]